MRTFQERLRRCAERGNLTVSDLARWFGRPYATVRDWLVNGREPIGGPVTVRTAWDRLDTLETEVRRNGRELRGLSMRDRAMQLAGGSRK